LFIIGITGSRYHGITISRDHGITISRDHGITISRDRGITGSRDHGIMGSWDHGIMGSWDQVTLVLPLLDLLKFQTGSFLAIRYFSRGFCCRDRACPVSTMHALSLQQKP